MGQFFHIHVGTKLIASQFGDNEKDAILRYARKTNTSSLIYNTKPGVDVRESKQPRQTKEQIS